MTESKSELMARLRSEGRWAEASKFKDAEIAKLRSEGLKRIEAGGEGWRRMSEAFPPIEDEPVDVEVAGQADVVGDVVANTVDAATAFEDALSRLPPTAQYNVEIDWIRAHPAMMRQSRSKLSYVTITPQDIADAPSRSAVFALSHWANNPKEFFKMVLSEQKKAPEVSARDIEREEDPSLEEAERLLNQILGHKVQGNVGCPVE
jgi:hypothetical protein